MWIHTLKKHRKPVNKLLWLLSSFPGAYIFSRYIDNDMTENPFEFLTQHTGHWAMIFFLLSYAITPMRRWLRFIASANRWTYGKRLADWNFLIFHRRLLGLCCFYYASAHLYIYLYFELDFDWNELYFEITHRTFILLGLVGWLLLLILALTSPDFMQKRLKKNWRRIHKLIHIIAAILLCHLILEAKILFWYLWVYLILFTILTTHRMLVLIIPSLQNKADDGMVTTRKRAK